MFSQLYGTKHVSEVINDDCGKLLAPKHPDFVPAAIQRHFGRVKHAAGFNGKDGETVDGKKLRPWVQDYMRHTAVSMYLAKHKHEGASATWAGNSPNVIHRHDKGLVKDADATEFWNLTPAAVLSGIVTYPGQACHKTPQASTRSLSRPRIVRSDAA